MADALKRFDPEFTPRHFIDYPRWVRNGYKLSSRQAPFAVVGDFNGDRIQDVVVLGDNRVAGRCLVILSSGKDFKVVDVQIERESRAVPSQKSDSERDEYDGIQTGLSLVRPGIIRSPYEDRPLRTTTDAFEVTHYEASAKVVYYRDGVWREYWTSN